MLKALIMLDFPALFCPNRTTGIPGGNTIVASSIDLNFEIFKVANSAIVTTQELPLNLKLLLANLDFDP